MKEFTAYLKSRGIEPGASKAPDVASDSPWKGPGEEEGEAEPKGSWREV